MIALCTIQIWYSSIQLQALWATNVPVPQKWTGKIC